MKTFNRQSESPTSKYCYEAHPHRNAQGLTSMNPVYIDQVILLLLFARQMNDRNVMDCYHQNEQYVDANDVPFIHHSQWNETIIPSAPG